MAIGQFWAASYGECNGFDIKTFNYLKDELPEIELSIDLSIRKHATIAGSRMFLSPNLMTKWTTILDEMEIRKSEVYVNTAFTHTDTVRYVLPTGINPEFLSDPVIIDSSFGEYKSSITQGDKELIYTRKMVLNKGKYPKESYKELRDFYNKISKADKIKIVLRIGT